MGEVSVRVEHIGDATLYLGDCLEVMPTLDLVDHVFADPPYEKHMHVAKKGARSKMNYGSPRKIRTDGHANPPPVDFASIDGIREQAAKAMAKAGTGWLLVFCTPEGVCPWRDAIEAASVRYKRACHWIKPDSAPQFNGQGPAMGAEMFVTAWCGQGISKWNGGGRRNVFTHPCQPPDRDGRHPTEKPIGLMAELLTLFTSPDQLVLDPFMGSGTTGVACARYGRRFIGIEQDPKWFEIACGRITAAYQQPRLFQERPAKIKQASFLDDTPQPAVAAQ